MAKYTFLLSALMAILVCIEAAPNTSDGSKSADSPKLDNTPYEEIKNIDEKSTQGQRHKRFYNYINFGFNPYGSFNPYFYKRDQSQDTGVHGTADFVPRILKNVQEILYYTRQHQVPSFIPLPILIPQAGCECSPEVATPSHDEEPGSDVPIAPDTAPTTYPTNHTAPTTTPATDTSTPTNQTDNTVVDFPTRSMFEDEDDTRPISFQPIKPDRPLSRPPPAVDHGSDQATASNVNELEEATTRPPPLTSGVAPQPHLPTNAIPTLCDGAVLTCCHKPEVTYDCFVMQGCPNPKASNAPCDANIIFSIILKFQNYYAKRIQV